MRIAAVLVALLTVLASTSAAFAHASLLRAEPADGAVVAEAPTVLRFTFNEPVSPLVFRLIAPDGSVSTPVAVAENSTVTVRPPALQRGTHVLSWRVVSADGHPVGGTIMFSVGAASARPSPAVPASSNTMVRAAIWTARLVIYAALVFGIGGAFFLAWFVRRSDNLRLRGATIGYASPTLIDVPSPAGGAGRASVRWLDSLLIGLIVAGLVATPLSLGLQGLDALDAGFAGLAEVRIWAAGLKTSYGLTAIVLGFALLAGLMSFRVPWVAARALSLMAMGLAGLALALSGHAGNAAPQVLTRPSVFVHVVCVSFWIGALLPLLAAAKTGDQQVLARFTRVIPYPLVALVMAGVVLAMAQLDRVDALWTTPYGIVLSSKLAAVLVLLALAAGNRFVLMPRHRSAVRAATPRLVRSIAAETCIAVIILALVASWRFTPPPRALAAAEPIELHLHGTRAMAQITITPVRARSPTVNVEVLDSDLKLLPVKEVAFILADPSAKIEPIRRSAAAVEGVRWRVDDVRIPIAGRWIVRVDLLINDFEKIMLEDEVDLPRLP